MHVSFLKTSNSLFNTKDKKMKNQFIFLLTFSAFIFFQSCIGDDFIDDNVDPILRITNVVDTIQIDTSYQFEYIYLNYIGREENIDVLWTSSDESIIQISSAGLAIANDLGSAL